MTKKTILILSTYPIRRSFHGGQRRVRAISDAYESFGYEVIQTAIFNPGSYVHSYERSKNDLAAPSLTEAKIKANPLLEDIILGQSCSEDPTVREYILNLLDKYKPDYIDLHQPYLYIGLKELLAKISNPPKLIYSSQNIEYLMKAEIYSNHSAELDPKVAERAVELIRSTEQELSTAAAIVTTVSQADALEHRRMGAKNIVLVPNGINPPSTTSKHVEVWKNFFHNNGIESPILFTGSAHPPNWTGFLDMVGGRLGFLPISSKLMIVGDIGDALEYVLHLKDPVYSSSFWLRAHNCRRLSDEDLGALIGLCDTIILPITEGGGSNLKTAEAIYSGKKIVTTDYAMRGYDEFIGFPNIFIAKDAQQFKQLLLKTLKHETPKLTKTQRALADKVLWSTRTQALKAAVEEQE